MTTQRFFLLRVLLLVGVLVAFDLWLVRHTGHGMSDPRVIGGIGGVVVAILAVAEKVLAATDAAGWKSFVRELTLFYLPCIRAPSAPSTWWRGS